MYEGTDFFAASEEDYKYARLILETMLPEAIESVHVMIWKINFGRSAPAEWRQKAAKSWFVLRWRTRNFVYQGSSW